MTAYYNEKDAFAAAWLRELIKGGHIAPGEVDERSIEDVRPSDLRGYAQCHFFAGIGVWSYALRQAGWPDEREVWTGSCPCQPFSAAGQRKGTADERHLWPALQYLIAQCKPATFFGEQVASKDGLAWFDTVQADLEGEAYAVGVCDLCAAGFGAPHIRQRLYFVGARLGESNSAGLQSRRRSSETLGYRDSAIAASGNVRVVNSPSEQVGVSGCSRESRSACCSVDNSADSRRQETRECYGRPSLLAARPEQSSGTGGELANNNNNTRLEGRQGAEERSTELPSGPSGLVNGFWQKADWITCRDGKYRPVEPLAQQMADGSTESLGSLCRENIEELEKEIMNAYPSPSDAGKALHNLWKTLSAEALRIWSFGRPSDLSQAPFLLAFLRQLSQQGWAFSKSIPREGSEEKEAFLRELRQQESLARSSHRRELDEQSGGESSNSLCVLPSILARHAQATWAEAFQQNARDAFPLIHGAINRVGRLRGYGNALVAPVAQGFIEAFLEVERESAR